MVKSDNYGGSSNPPTSVDVSENDGFITYTITVSNSGSSALDGVVVSDSLSTNPALADDTFTATETGGASGFTAAATGAGFNDIDDTVDLPGNCPSPTRWWLTSPTKTAPSGFPIPPP